MIDHSSRQKTIHLLLDKHRAALLGALAARHGVRPMIYARSLIYKALETMDPEAYAAAEAQDLGPASIPTKGPKPQTVALL